MRVVPLLEPAEKKASSDKEVDVSEPLVLERLRGGGVKRTSPRKRGPLETVTGAPSPTGRPTRPNPNPKPPLASRASRAADSISSPRSVSELVRRRERIRVGPMTPLPVG